MLDRSGADVDRDSKIGFERSVLGEGGDCSGVRGRCTWLACCREGFIGEAGLCSIVGVDGRSFVTSLSPRSSKPSVDSTL